MRLEFLGDPQLEFLKEGRYILEGETAQDRYREIVDRVRDYEEEYQEPGLAKRMEEWLDKNYIQVSTPVLSNFGRKKSGNIGNVGFPASCNIVTVNDSIHDIWGSDLESALLSKHGAGVGADFTRVTQKGTLIGEGFNSNSKLDYIERLVDTAQKVSQGHRRGYIVPFLIIDDNDFDELMRRIDKTNSNQYDVLANNTVGIILPKGFNERIKTDKELQRRYMVVLNERMKTGRVYLVHLDNMNINSSEVYKKLGMVVETTNICTEFVQPLFDDMTSVCVLSALNLVHWDYIKEHPEIIRDLFIFLDIVNEEYVRLTKGVKGLEKAHKGAKMKRDIGAGTLGLAEYFQIKGVGFGDPLSRAYNKQIYKLMREVGDQTTRELAEKLGPAPLAKMAGLMVRNCSLMMVAPNKSTSFLADATSAGIEPFMSNIFSKNLAKIQYIFKNKYLEKLLEEKGKNTREVWRSIEDNNGSVQHLDFLSIDEKNVFRTFSEISPKDIIDLASDRQVYIDMSQSLNLVHRKNYTIKDIYDMHKYAWDKGIKTLYYMYSSAHAVLEKEGEAWDECISCAD